MQKTEIEAGGAIESLRKIKKCNKDLRQIDQKIKKEGELYETATFIYKRSLEENRIRDEQVNECMIVVNYYENTIEKWHTLQHTSEKERKEAQNTLSNSTSVYNKRQNENRRKLGERRVFIEKVEGNITGYDNKKMIQEMEIVKEMELVKKLEDRQLTLTAKKTGQVAFKELIAIQLEEYHKKYQLLQKVFAINELGEI